MILWAIVWILSDDSGPGNPLGRRALGKAVVSWMKEGISAMVREVACAQERGESKEAEERMGTGHNLVALVQPYLLARPMPEGLEPLCLRASLHYPTIFDHYQRELRVALQASQVHETYNVTATTIPTLFLVSLLVCDPEHSNRKRNV